MTERLTLAEQLLQEAVYRSRAGQAATAGLRGGGAEPSGPSNCGLGREAEVVLDLSERGAELFRQLWPAERDPDELERLREITGAWIVRQDALDRDRNHFLKAFRREHGFDRAAYTPEQLGSYEAGLDAINAKENEERRAAAQQLLARG